MRLCMRVNVNACVCLCVGVWGLVGHAFVCGYMCVCLYVCMSEYVHVCLFVCNACPQRSPGSGHLPGLGDDRGHHLFLHLYDV